MIVLGSPGLPIFLRQSDRPKECGLLRSLWNNAGRPPARDFVPIATLGWLARHDMEKQRHVAPDARCPLASLVPATSATGLLVFGDGTTKLVVAPDGASLSTADEDTRLRVLTPSFSITGASTPLRPGRRSFVATVEHQGLFRLHKLPLRDVVGDPGSAGYGLFRKRPSRPLPVGHVGENDLWTGMCAVIAEVARDAEREDEARRLAGRWPPEMCRAVLARRDVAGRLERHVADLADLAAMESRQPERLRLRLDRPSRQGDAGRLHLDLSAVSRGVNKSRVEIAFHLCLERDNLLPGWGRLIGPERAGRLAAPVIDSLGACGDDAMSAHRRITLLRKFRRLQGGLRQIYA